MRKEHNDDNLRKQFQYLAKIRGWSRGHLRQVHERIFIGTKYYVDAARCPRDYLEKRLLSRFQLKHPHFTDKHPKYREWRRATRNKLLEPPPAEVDEAMERKLEMRERVLFTRDRIASMDERLVDAYLQAIGLTVDADATTKRKVLWEYYNTKSYETPVGNQLTRRKRGFRQKKIRGPETNEYVLQDVILRFPYMGWPEFREYLGDVMPTVTSNSFYVARCILRKRYGIELPRLNTGRKTDNAKLQQLIQAENYDDDLSDDVRLKRFQWKPEDVK